MLGGEGSDTYLYYLGDGNDILREGPSTGQNRLFFGPGIEESDLSFEKAGIHLDILVRNASGSVTGTVRILAYYSTGQPPWIIEFDNGDTISQVIVAPGVPTNAPDLLEGSPDGDVIRGLGGGDDISGFDGDDYLEGGPDDDTLRGGLGSDVFGVGPGDGIDTIRFDPVERAPGDVDVLRFLSGIDPADVHLLEFTDRGELLVWPDREPLQYVVIENWDTAAAAADWPVQSIEFDGGTTWDAAAITSRIVTTFTGSDLNADGVTDLVAIALGINPFAIDLDGDGLTNLVERQLGTGLFDSDSDGDGVFDSADADPLDPHVTTFPGFSGDPLVIEIFTPSNAVVTP
ncbi:MAG: hypothetical protein HKN82_17780 [Akkermansiaceae bacterium]|nr:hypothetical protein [Akkermansiaceae bacterium]